IGYGDHSLPQPESQHCASVAEIDANMLYDEAGVVSASCAKSPSFARTFSIFTLVVLLSSLAFAQTGGKISGAVKDRTGALIPGSEVVLLNPATGIKQNTATGADGVFNFPVVAIGQYQLEVTKADVTPYRQTSNLNIDVTTSLTLDVVLQVAESSQTVTVTENTAAVHLTDTQIGQTIQSRQVQDIPLNRR